MYTTLRRMTVVFVMVLESSIFRQSFSMKVCNIRTCATSLSSYPLSFVFQVKLSVGIMVLGALIAGARDLSFDLKSYVAVLIYDISTAIYLGNSQFKPTTQTFPLPALRDTHHLGFSSYIEDREVNESQCLGSDVFQHATFTAPTGSS